jgi:hypothetical protein
LNVGIAVSITALMELALSLLARLPNRHQPRDALLVFPLVYFLIPYLAVAPSTTSAPDPVSGLSIWFDFVVVSFLHVVARMSSQPPVSSLAQTPASQAKNDMAGFDTWLLIGIFRAAGPLVAAWRYGHALENGIVGEGWWPLSVIALIGWVYAREAKRR